MNFIKKRIFLFCAFILSGSFCFGEALPSTTSEPTPENLETKTGFVGQEQFSLDWSFMMKALLSYYENDFSGPAKHSAFVIIPGLGFSYEKQFLKKFSLKGSFDFASYIEKDSNREKLWLEAIGLSLCTYCYPFANQRLEKLYFGGGIATNFLMFTGDSILKEDEKRTAISVFPAVGWKQHFGEWACVNLFCAWRFLINDDSIPAFADDAYIKGFDYGIKFSFNLGKITRKVLKKN